MAAAGIEKDRKEAADEVRGKNKKRKSGEINTSPGLVRNGIV